MTYAEVLAAASVEAVRKFHEVLNDEDNTLKSITTIREELEESAKNAEITPEKLAHNISKFEPKMKLWLKVQLEPIDVYLNEEDFDNIVDEPTRLKILEAASKSLSRSVARGHTYLLGNLNKEIRLIGRTKEDGE